MRDREVGIAERAADLQPVFFKLQGPRGAHQESDIRAGLREPAAEVAAGAACTKDKNAHHRQSSMICRSKLARMLLIFCEEQPSKLGSTGYQLRRPTPRFSNHNPSAPSPITKPSISV